MVLRLRGVVDNVRTYDRTRFGEQIVAEFLLPSHGRKTHRGEKILLTVGENVWSAVGLK